MVRIGVNVKIVRERDHYENDDETPGVKFNYMKSRAYKGVEPRHHVPRVVDYCILVNMFVAIIRLFFPPSF